MSKGRALVVGAATLIASSLLAAPAWSAACVEGSVASYIALGATGCSVGPITFSSISVTTLTSNGGQVNLGSFTPFFFSNEFGLTLGYSALAQTPNATADLKWEYNVSGVPDINDAFLQLAGNTEGSGRAVVSETLSNNVVLSLNAPGSTTATFAPVPSLHVLKDQIDFVGMTAGFATTSALTNAFSVVPGPIAGAGLPGLVVACGGLIGLARRRRRQIA
jgi:hypothetical protein